MMWHEGIEVTLIPGNSDEHATGNPPGLWLHGGRAAIVRRRNHWHRPTTLEAAQRDAGLSPRGILESEDASPLCERQHRWHADAMRRGGPLDPPPQHPSEHAQGQMGGGTLQHTGIGIGFRPPKAGPALPNRPQP